MPEPVELRSRLALALDVDDQVAAMRLAHELRPWFAVAKVGLELYSAAGPDTVAALLDEGFGVFLDLKLHDIPTTVGRAARVLGALGVSYLTAHASGGAVMLRAAVDGLADGAGHHRAAVRTTERVESPLPAVSEGKRSPFPAGGPRPSNHGRGHGRSGERAAELVGGGNHHGGAHLVIPPS